MSKKSVFVVVIALAVLALANIACTDTGSVTSNSTCTIQPGQANCKAADGTIVYPTAAPQMVKKVDPTVAPKSDPAADAMKNVVKGVQKGANIVKSNGDVLTNETIKDCGDKGHKPGTGNQQCNP